MELTLKEIFEKPEWAESKAKAFFIESDPHEIYFTTSEKPFIFNSPGRLKAYIEVIKYYPKTGDVFYQSIYIKHSDVIIAITIAEAKTYMEETIESFKKNRPSIAPHKRKYLLTTFSKLGYNI